MTEPREVIYVGWPGEPATGPIRLLVDAEGRVLKNLDEEAIANAVPGVKP